MVENNNSESTGNIFISSCNSSDKTSRNSKCINVNNNSNQNVSASKNCNSKKTQNLVSSSCISDSNNDEDNTSVCDTDIDYDNNSIHSANDKLDLCMQNEKYRNKDKIVVNERKLVNKMISNYYNSQSVNIEDNRHVLKRLLPIYNNLIDASLNFVEKVNKLKHNLNPTKSSKTFRLIYESYRTLFFNLNNVFSSILDVKYKGVDVLEYSINNIETNYNNKINYAACNNFYETNSCLDKSTLFYSVPGFTILINYETLAYRIIAKKSNFNSRSKIFKYDFLLVPGSISNCHKVSKTSFLKVIDSITNFRNDKNNNLLEFINFLHHELKSVKCLI